MTPKLVPSNAFSQLDDLLDRIGVKLQISETRYNLAVSRYETIGEWLRAEASPIARFKPTIYPQGSLRIQTTVKPRGHNEFDLDLVCEFQADPRSFYNPVELLNIVEKRLRDNLIYSGMIKRKNRCICINYADKFHLDIVPAVPNCSSDAYGETCVLVPDRNLQDWQHSNPKGYAKWFETIASEMRIKMKRNLEPMPEQQTYEELVTLNRAVQLIKRYRDISLEHLEGKKHPVSVVLTTLAAQAYSGQRSVTEAVSAILNGMIARIPTDESRLVVLNPTNINEDLSERWGNDPETYRIFVSWLADFQHKWNALMSVRGIENVKLNLEKMFGERITKEVVEDYVKSYQPYRENGSLAVAKSSGIIVPATTPSSIPVKINTFYGD